MGSWRLALVAGLGLGLGLLGGMDAIVDRADRDGDGYVDLEEMLALGFGEDVIVGLMREIDLDGDGRLSMEEIRLATAKAKMEDSKRAEPKHLVVKMGEGPFLREVERRDVMDLSIQEFARDYVATRKPLILTGVFEGASKEEMLDLQVMETLCGSNRVKFDMYHANVINALSQDQLDFLRGQVGPDRFDSFMEKLRNGMSVGEYIKYMKEMEAEEDGAITQESRNPTNLIELAAEYMQKPAYMHDSELRQICPELLPKAVVPPQMSVNWLYMLADLHESTNPNLKSLPKLFIGPKNSQAYPMHLNTLDYDLWMGLPKGRKKFTMFPQEQAGFLSEQKLFSDRVFMLQGLEGNHSESPLYTHASGWSGILQEGEFLYMPRGTLHEFKNLELVVSYVGWFAFPESFNYLWQAGMPSPERIASFLNESKLGLLEPKLGSRRVAWDTIVSAHEMARNDLRKANREDLISSSVPTLPLLFQCCGAPLAPRFGSKDGAVFLYIPFLGYFQTDHPTMSTILFGAMGTTVAIVMSTIFISYCTLLRETKPDQQPQYKMARAISKGKGGSEGKRNENAKGKKLKAFMCSLVIAFMIWVPIAYMAYQTLIPARYLIGYDRDFVHEQVVASEKVFNNHETHSHFRHPATFSFLSSQECEKVLESVYKLREYWTHRTELGGPTPTFTLGAASYLDGIHQKSFSPTMNDVLKKEFDWLYIKLLHHLQEILHEPVAYKSGAALPGFHIFLSNRGFEFPVATVHVDLQYTQNDFPEETSDLDNPISFTVALSLPQGRTGLYEYSRSPEICSRDDMEKLVVKNRITGEPEWCRVLYEYKLGHTAFHSGHVVHQIAPGRYSSPRDARITLQGHGVRNNGVWEIYW